MARMNAVEQIFESYGKQTVQKLRESFKRNDVNASGRLSNSVEYDVVQTGMISASLRVSMFRYGLTAEDGRGPTKKGGRGDLLQRIRRWIDEKGINVPQPEKMGLAYAITKKIHKEGTLQYQRTLQTGRGSGVISDVINETLINEIVAEVADGVAKEVADGLATGLTNRTIGRNGS